MAVSCWVYLPYVFKMETFCIYKVNSTCNDVACNAAFFWSKVQKGPFSEIFSGVKGVNDRAQMIKSHHSNNRNVNI